MASIMNLLAGRSTVVASSASLLVGLLVLSATPALGMQDVLDGIDDDACLIAGGPDCVSFLQTEVVVAQGKSDPARRTPSASAAKAKRGNAAVKMQRGASASATVQRGSKASSAKMTKSDGAAAASEAAELPTPTGKKEFSGMLRPLRHHATRDLIAAALLVLCAVPWNGVASAFLRQESGSGTGDDVVTSLLQAPCLLRGVAVGVLCLQQSEMAISPLLAAGVLFLAAMAIELTEREHQQHAGSEGKEDHAVRAFFSKYYPWYAALVLVNHIFSSASSLAPQSIVASFLVKQDWVCSVASTSFWVLSLYFGAVLVLAILQRAMKQDCTLPYAQFLALVILPRTLQIHTGAVGADAALGVPSMRLQLVMALAGFFAGLAVVRAALARISLPLNSDCQQSHGVDACSNISDSNRPHEKED